MKQPKLKIGVERYLFKITTGNRKVGYMSIIDGEFWYSYDNNKWTKDILLKCNPFEKWTYELQLIPNTKSKWKYGRNQIAKWLEMRFHGDSMIDRLLEKKSKAKQDQPVCEQKTIIHQEVKLDDGSIATFDYPGGMKILSPPTKTTKHLDKLVVPNSLGGGLEGIGDCIRLSSGIKMWDKINQLVLFNKQLLINLKEIQK